MSKLILPVVCPNYLAADPQSPISVVRSMPGVTTTIDWPFCERCALTFSQYTKWKKKFAIMPAVLLAFLGGLIAAMTNDRGIHQSAWWCLLAAVVVSVLAASRPTSYNSVQ
jgi:hypothetical protein